MLTGRESLLRVVGKRRRNLPNRLSLLSASSSTFQSCLSPCQIDENVNRKSVEETASGGGDLVESVNCPVCGTQLRGLDNTLINSHLDECLAKGSKRKLSQLTLLQFNFSRSKVKVRSNWPNDKGDQVIPSDPNRISSCDLIHNVNELVSSEEDDSNHHFISLRNNPFATDVEDLVSDVFADNKFPSLPLLSEIERPKYVVKEYFDDHDIYEVSIPTSIVGRRYGSRKELDPESRVCLSRDPENVKDPNAIKVLYADCEYDNMLGYIPRELAQYLSPLIDRFDLNFEGASQGSSLEFKMISRQRFPGRALRSDSDSLGKNDSWRSAFAPLLISRVASAPFSSQTRTTLNVREDKGRPPERTDRRDLTYPPLLISRVASAPSGREARSLPGV
ncbi:Fanconi-associated nuclease 1 [Sesamum alatum]|uniref:Fanconi-associated nuclease n=1 Tax=Sesamum alatum TaxID=300844 RepID=A0AAE2CHB0_9LAMI|nr:Fanconi-associated nuclease 1 [Sesamum alatum]